MKISRSLLMGGITAVLVLIISVIVLNIINTQDHEQITEPQEEQVVEHKEDLKNKFVDYVFFDDRIEMDVVKQREAKINFEMKLAEIKAEKELAAVEQVENETKENDASNHLETVAKNETKQNKEVARTADEQKSKSPNNTTNTNSNNSTQSDNNNSSNKSEQKEENPKQKDEKPKSKEQKPQVNLSAGASLEKQVVNLVNKEREKHGLNPVSQSNELVNLARLKAADMYENGYFSHTSPTYGDPFQMMANHGISYQYAGENIAKGHTTAEEVVAAWMDSPSHREVMLKSEFTHIGVGYVERHWVQLFIQK